MVQRLMFILILCLQIGSSQAAEPWKEPEDFRGLKWGASPAEAKKFFPTIKPYYHEEGPVQSYFTKGEQITDTLIVEFILHFSDKRFFAASMEFRTELFDEVSGIFQARYGRPHSTSKNVLKNAFGASFQNVTHSWSGPSVAIELERHESATQGNANIGKKEFLARIEKSKQRRTKDAAKGF